MLAQPVVKLNRARAEARPRPCLRTERWDVIRGGLQKSVEDPWLEVLDEKLSAQQSLGYACVIPE